MTHYIDLYHVPRIENIFMIVSYTYKMKLFTCITILFTTCGVASAQDLKKLDEKFGFQNFKLETSFQNYKKDLEFMFEGYDHVKYYRYKKVDIKSVFGIDINEINLGFFENKLYTISIDFFTTDDFEEKHLQKNLTDLFGQQKLLEQSTSSDEQSKYEWGMIWKTEKISMQLSKYSCSSKISPCQTELFMYSNSMHKKINNDKF